MGWLQSRFLIIGMAAVQQPDGRTLVALTAACGCRAGPS
jgi:hypothetical protein